MPALTLNRAPLGLLLSRAFAPIFCVALAVIFALAARWYAVTTYAPETSAIVILAASAALLLAAAWAHGRYASIPLAVKVSRDGAVTVVTTRGERTVPAKDVYGVVVVRFGVALKYRGVDGRDAWIGIENGYVDERGTYLSGYRSINRINAAIGPKAIRLGRIDETTNAVMLRAALILLGLLVLVIGAVGALRVLTQT